TMRVLLPRARSGEVLAQPEVQATAQGQARILLVDDELPLVEVWREALTGLGYQVTTADSGEQALTLFAASPDGFDLVLTDQILPGLSGTDFVGGVRALRPGLPVIVWTGYSDAAAREAATGLGVFEILSKPVRQADLVRCLERALSAPHGGQEPVDA
ncbi:MAG: response regulator, partial [Humidesulfovibrio sp.]|nr:response regulator [Humidesulfovibrio sp.]